MFDLPVVTDQERKAATAFRNFLLDEGFDMAQYSVYMRGFAGKERTEAVIARIKSAVPPAGKVSVLCFTDKQYENIVNFTGGIGARPKNPDQFTLF